MSRVTNVPATRRRHRKYLRAAKGFVGGRRRLYRTAKETVMRSWRFAYRDRRVHKRVERRLWTVRLNAACRQAGLKYSQLVGLLAKKGIRVNRQALAELCVSHPRVFSGFLKTVQS